LWPPAGERGVVTGQTEPLQGWVAQPHGELIPAPALVETLAGREATFLAVLSPAGMNKTSVTVSVADDGAIQVQSDLETTSLAIADDFVEVTTTGEDRKTGDADETGTSAEHHARIELTRAQLPLGYPKPIRPLGFRLALVFVLLHVAAWALVWLMLWWKRLKHTWWGTGWVLLAAAVNLSALVIVWPYVR